MSLPAECCFESRPNCPVLRACVCYQPLVVFSPAVDNFFPVYGCGVVVHVARTIEPPVVVAPAVEDFPACPVSCVLCVC